MTEDIQWLGDEEGYARAPRPFSHIIASPVFSGVWGRGWLGYTLVGDDAYIWHVHGDLNTADQLEYSQIVRFDDRYNSHIWLVFLGARIYVDRVEVSRYYGSLAFLLNPPEDAVVFPLPGRLRSFLSEHG